MTQWTVQDEEVRIAEERELQQELIAAGVNPGTKKFVDALQVAAERGREQADRAQEADQAREKNKTVQYTRQFARGALAVTAVVFVLLVIALGMTGGVGLLLWAEFEAVKKGFGVVDEGLSSLYAGASIGMFVSLSLVQLLIADNEGISKSEMFNLRMVRRWWRHFTGKDGGVRYREASLYEGAQAARQWLMWTIVLFGVLGRLRDIIRGAPALQDAAWYDGLAHLATDSNLETMTGTVGTLVMTVGLLAGTHFIVYFMYQMFRGMTGVVNLNFTFAALSPEEYVWREQRKVYLVALERQRRKAQGALASTNGSSSGSSSLLPRLESNNGSKPKLSGDS